MTKSFTQSDKDISESIEQAFQAGLDDGKEVYKKANKLAREQVREEERERIKTIIIGWREFDWPKDFHRKTAQMIADNLENRLNNQDK